MNHYPMHPGDYLRDTSHLSLIEDAIYRRAIDWLYINERPLPADTKKAARLLRAADHLEAVEAVFEEFLTLTDDGWTQTRVDREISEYRARADSARENGKKGGRPPKQEEKPKITDPVNSGYPKKTEPETNQNQNQNQNQLKAAAAAREAVFSEPVEIIPESRRKTAMRLDWKPGPMFADRAKTQGINPDNLTPEILAAFASHYEADGRQENLGQWENLLVKWLKRERPANVADIRAAAKPAPVEKKTEYWTPDPKRMMTPDELAVLHAGRALLK